jgi:eukaryotic-like serine/threonine-protein kinase
LAKAYAGDKEEVNLSNSPTLSDAATQQGVILGTAAYMSPEQARGESVDKKADIWAFGVVLFEMLTGRGMFEGRTVSDTLAAVLMREPEWKRLPLNLHPRIRLLLERCLEKELKNRYGLISDARVDIQKVLADPNGVLVQPVMATEPRKKLRSILPWVAALVLTAIIVGVAVWNLRKPKPPQVLRFDYELPEVPQLSIGQVGTFAVSRDGSQIVSSAAKGLYLRSMDGPAFEEIPGTEGAASPFFSPDGRWIGYFSLADQKLKKIAISGGAPVTLADFKSIPFGADWYGENAIVYSQYPGDCMRISADGGPAESIIKGSFDRRFALRPQILPSGKSILYTAFAPFGPTQSRIMVQSLESGERKELFAGANAQYLPTGHLVYMLDNNLFAARFDLDRLETIGGPVSIVEGVMQYAVSDSGMLVYALRKAPAASLSDSGRALVWVNRDGKEEPISAPPDDYRTVRISPDGTKVALSLRAIDVDSMNINIWILDLIRETRTRLTFGGMVNALPLWTPDGKRIAYASASAQGYRLYWKAADGTGKEDPLGSMPGGGFIPASWSDSGKNMLVMEGVQLGTQNIDIGLLSMEGDRKYRPLLKEKYREAQPHVSPDGRWMAYASNESGKNEVYIRPFPEVEKGRWQVSTSGGDSPLWSPDGQELFYRSGDSVMAVAVKTSPVFNLETPEALFQGSYISTSMIGPLTFNAWDISPDGKRFLMMKETSSTGSAGGVPLKINIVLNWTEELKQRVPVK